MKQHSFGKRRVHRTIYTVTSIAETEEGKFSVSELAELWIREEYRRDEGLVME